MNTKVIFYKALCAALIPATAVAAGMVAVAMKEYPEQSFTLMVLVVSFNTVNAAFSGLNSFLSRTFADHEDAAHADNKPAATPQLQ